jgi:hypothetical protein
VVGDGRGIQGHRRPIEGDGFQCNQTISRTAFVEKHPVVHLERETCLRFHLEDQVERLTCLHARRGVLDGGYRRRGNGQPVRIACRDDWRDARSRHPSQRHVDDVALDGFRRGALYAGALSSGTFTNASLTWLAADLDSNLQNIDFAGLQTSGLALV